MSERLTITELEQIRQRAEAAGEQVVFPEELDGYAITDSGKVISYSHNWRGYGTIELKQHPNSKGYYRVRLTIKGERKSYFVHKLVAKHFLENPNGTELQIRHLDGDKSNNRADNLKWGTAKENANDRDLHGTTARGSRNGFSKLTENDVEEIKELFTDSKLSRREIGKIYGVSKETICRISVGKTWSHVGEEK